MNEERDISPLEIEIRRLIAGAGPMPVSQYMSLCLAHPQHGYYVTRDPFGLAGDFVTAPETSQMFGELIGLWMAAMWQQLGSPTNIRIVELGPGRGTMMADAMRAAKIVPGFNDATVIHLVEASPTLQGQQAIALSGMPVHWHTALEEVPDGPSIIVANEFFDALPVHQSVKQADGWHERTIEINADGNFAFGISPGPVQHFEKTLPPKIRKAAEGALFEWRGDYVAMEIGRRIGKDMGAALIIDYGHAHSEVGETLQAVGKHAYADPLEFPGNVDLTAHVDFEALAHAASSMGAEVYGPLTQSEFLRRLGIEERAKVLKQNAKRAKAHEIDAALARLIGHGRTGMGELFKVAAYADPRAGVPPGFTK